MPRQQVNSPLAGAAPVLQPTARPLSITLGATPPPTRSPLMELAEAFQSFNPELRGMLRDSAAKEEQDAQALGEITASKLKSEHRMAEIETVLKKEVDEGRLPSWRLPAARRGFAFRSGVETAETEFQTAIAEARPAAINGDTETVDRIIAENLKKYGDAIPANDFYARQGFNKAALQVIADFRDRTGKEAQEEGSRRHREQLSNMGSELAMRIAEADTDALPVAAADFLEHMATARSELKKSETNGFVVERILAPAVAKLVDERKFPEARQLLDQAEKLDVTGEGGLLGQTAVAKTAFATLRNQIERNSRASHYEDLENYRADREYRSLQGTDEAGADLQKLRLDNGGALPLDKRFNLIDEYRLKNPGDAVKVAAYAQAVNSDYEHEEKFRANERTVSDFLLQVNTLDKDRLDAVEAAIEGAYNAQLVPASARTQLLDTIQKRRALSGFVDEGDFRTLKRNMFAVSQATAAMGPTINFGDTASVALWERLNVPAKEAVEFDTMAYYKEQLEQHIIEESGGDPNKVAGFKALAVEKATSAAQTFARNRTVQAVKEQRNLEVKAAVARTAAIIATRPVRKAEAPPLQYAVIGKILVPEDIPGDGPRDQTRVTMATYKPPVGSFKEITKKGAQTGPDADYVRLPSPGATSNKLIKALTKAADPVVDMKALAGDFNAEADPYKKRTIGDLYGYLKWSLGYTPEEIKAGKTNHGVVFDASRIDPTVIPVFRSVAELNKHWNNGQPDETFMAVGDAVDPDDRMKPRDFYLYQRALLRSK